MTHIEAIQHNDAASWNYDPTAEEYYYGFGCTIVSTGSKIPICLVLPPINDSLSRFIVDIPSD